MTSNPHAGQLVDPKELVNLPRLVTAYFTGEPDAGIASQRVALVHQGTAALRSTIHSMKRMCWR